MYLSANWLLLGDGVLVDLTARATKANQNGLLGFGGVANDSDRSMPELSIAFLLRRRIAIGVDYRVKPA